MKKKGNVNFFVSNQKIVLPHGRGGKPPYQKMGNSQRLHYQKKPFILKNELVESRKKAALRVHEYKQTTKPVIAKNPQVMQNAFTSGPKFVKPSFH